MNETTKKPMIKGLGKTASTCCVIFLVGIGGIIAFLMPDHMDSYQQLCYSISPLLGAQIAAIFGGNMIKKNNASSN